MNASPFNFGFAALFGATVLMAQDTPRPPASPATTNLSRIVRSGPNPAGGYASDIVVVREAQQQALEQVRAMKEDVDDPRGKALLEAVELEMEKALARLGEATDKNGPAQLPPALAAEQSAYQALLKLAAREYQVSRGNKQGGGGGGDRAQRQLDQLDLKQAENRYETQRQATPQQSSQQREQLQVLNRLKELAQRQQDLNERIQELQTALQEAKTEEEREEIRRRLKRLREQEQEMLADLDELQQRMDRSENQSRDADARQKLDQTRSEIQRAAEALDGQAVPQALSSGTRAQRNLQQLSDEFRKKTSSQFADDMRRMRNDARQLAQKQDDLAQKLDQLNDPTHKTLSDSAERRDLGAQWTGQKGGVTNLVNQMRAVSEQAETAEPLLSKQLYDTLRQSNQEELNKSLDFSSELVQRGFLSQAGQFEQRARQGIDQLKQGVEKAAESVLGDDLESLRMARRELDDLSRRLEKEIAAAGTNAGPADAAASTPRELMTRRYGSARPANPGGTNTPAAGGGEPQSTDRQAGTSDEDGQNQVAKNQSSRDRNAQPGQQGDPAGQQPGGNPREGGASSQQAQNGSQNAPGQTGNPAQTPGQEGSAQDASSPGGQSGSSAQASNNSQSSSGRNNRSGGGARRNFFDGGGGGGGGEGGGYTGGPLTGDEFVDWSDRLRDVEEMLDRPELRSEVARIRDRARAVRWEYRQKGQKPDWAVVRLQIAGPLVEVSSRIGEELARRESNEAVVPIDRDPVPKKFSELVRRYYEELGKSD